MAGDGGLSVGASSRADCSPWARATLKKAHRSLFRKITLLSLRHVAELEVRGLNMALQIPGVF